MYLLNEMEMTLQYENSCVNLENTDRKRYEKSHLQTLHFI